MNASTQSKQSSEAARAEIKASDLFVRCLEAEGVTRIFGVPGEENADLMMSLMYVSCDVVSYHHVTRVRVSAG